MSVVCFAALLAGCFQPLYGNHTIGGGPGLRQSLSAVNVKQIAAPSGTPEARIAVELRNQLLFDLTGGSGELSPTHELKIQIAVKSAPIILDLTSQLPSAEDLALQAKYTLTDLTTGKQVVNGTTFARASYDIPGAEQRFARLRGRRDAENRAAKLVADNIRNRLASYFLAGT